MSVSVFVCLIVYLCLHLFVCVQAYQDLTGFILTLNEAVKDKKISDDYHVSQVRLTTLCVCVCVCVCEYVCVCACVCVCV